MATRSILISYAGYPYTPSSLMPDNGLANLAGALISAGHTPLVLDYGTVDTIKRLYPPNLSRKAKKFCEKAFGDPDQKYKPTFRDFLLLKYLDHQLTRHQESHIHRMGEEICQEIKKYRPDFIGFKLWTGDGFWGSIRIAQMVKKSFPRLPIFAGGPHVDLFRQLILKKCDLFDALAYAEGEETIVGIAERFQSKKSWQEIPNLIFQENGEIKVTETKWIEKLDQLPYPSYDHSVYPSIENNQKINIITTDESRGCFMGCYFCPHPHKSGTKLRAKSPERFVHEIERLIKKHSFTAFRYAGSATPTRLAKKIAEQIIQKQLNITYSMFGNIRLSRSGDFPTLKKSGCCAIFFGLESGSQEILNRSLGKHFRVDAAQKILQACRESGIFVIASIIFPAPFENDATRDQTLKLLKAVRPDSVIVTPSVLIPTTVWAAHPQRFNFRINHKLYEERSMYYKIKWIFPPRFWEPFPYTLNGKKFKDFTEETSAFSRSLSEEGLLTSMSDELIVMAHLSGHVKKEGDFLNLVRKLFFAGNWEGIKELAQTINIAIKRAATFS